MRLRLSIAIYSSAVILGFGALAGCGSKPGGPIADAGDAGVAADAGHDAGSAEDAGISGDGGSPDAGFADAGFADAGFADAGAEDAGSADAGDTDAGITDAGSEDAGVADAGVTDAGFADAGFPDAGFPDAGFPDGGAGLQAELVGTEIPNRIQPGAMINIAVTFKNTGSTTWSAPAVSLASANQPADFWGTTSEAVGVEVAPNQDYRFELAITAPGRTGRFFLRWQLSSSGTPFGPLLAVPIEITCDDGVFCNGIERFSGGTCVAGPLPCDDGVDCTTDTCIEAELTCNHAPAASGCADCKPCNGSCAGKQCGDNGCGQSCGSCGAGEGCEEGMCAVPSGPGSCANPIQIVPVGDQTLSADSSMAVHVTAPQCANESTAPEVVYSFTLEQPTVIDARVVGFDTVLSLRTTCGSVGSTIACNDDSDPPGWPGSRIARALEPGVYFLLVDGFNFDAQGPFTLTIAFKPGTCIPQCDNRHCGSDGCGGSCGTCVRGECGGDGRCVDSCARECEGRMCGTTSCGLSCGTCGPGTVCDPVGRCVPGQVCDHMQPLCNPDCGQGEYCGSDCNCYPVDQPLPDLTISADRITATLRQEGRTFRSTSCAVREGCVGAPGDREILRFEVRSPNIGHADLVIGPPSANPARYEYSSCHRHFHFAGYAIYELQDLAGNVVVEGRKQAFCLEDLNREVDSPEVSCDNKYTCGWQGIQRGWSDIYSNQLDCQWLDITGVPPGQYKLRVVINPDRVLHEVTTDNNEAIVDVRIR